MTGNDIGVLRMSNHHFNINNNPTNRRVIRQVQLGPNVNVRRALFGVADSEHIRRQLAEAMRNQHEISMARWHFDFGEERPLPNSNRYQWEQVRQEEMPAFYRERQPPPRPTRRPHVDRRCLSLDDIHHPDALHNPGRIPTLANGNRRQVELPPFVPPVVPEPTRQPPQQQDEPAAAAAAPELPTKPKGQSLITDFMRQKRRSSSEPPVASKRPRHDQGESRPTAETSGECSTTDPTAKP